MSIEASKNVQLFSVYYCFSAIYWFFRSILSNQNVEIYQALLAHGIFFFCSLRLFFFERVRIYKSWINTLWLQLILSFSWIYILFSRSQMQTSIFSALFLRLCSLLIQYNVCVCICNFFPENFLFSPFFLPRILLCQRIGFWLPLPLHRRRKKMIEPNVQHTYI